MFVVRLAWLNLTRSVRRTALSLSAVVVGVAVVVVGQAVIAGFEENAVRAWVDHYGGHVTARPASYPTEGLTHPIDALQPVDLELSRWLDASTRAWTTRTLAVGRAVAGADGVPVRIIGFDPARDPSVFPRDPWTLLGVEPTTASDGALLSVGVAGLLELSPGDRLVLEARTAAGARNALEVPVAGVVGVGTPLVDRFGVLVTDDLLARLIDASGTSHVSVRLGDRDGADAFAAELASRAGPSREVVTWMQETAAVRAFNAVRQAALNLLVVALLGMSATGIANTVLMATWERMAEIGTLRAMGMTRLGVVRLLVVEGALVGAMGSALGATLGGGIVWVVGERGIELPLALATSGNLPVSNLLYLRGSLGVTGLAVGFGVGVAVLASLWPAAIAARRAPADAVRG